MSVYEKGFKEFMKNPGWAEYYENAPTQAVKDYIRAKFEYDAFFTSDENIEVEDKELEKSELCKALNKQLDDSLQKITKKEFQYIVDNASPSLGERAAMRMLQARLKD